jgi:hypothetical protein
MRVKVTSTWEQEVEPQRFAGCEGNLGLLVECYIDHDDFMPYDDGINYTITAVEVPDKEFSSSQV